MVIERQYIVDNKNRKIAVQLNIETFKRIEDVLENYALYHLMNEEEDEFLNVSEAKAFYEGLTKEGNEG